MGLSLGAAPLAVLSIGIAISLAVPATGMPGSAVNLGHAPSFQCTGERTRGLSTPTDASVDKVLKAAHVREPQVAGASGIVQTQRLDDLILQSE